MNVVIRQAVPSDARDIITFMNVVAGETDNLTFGAGGFPVQDPSREAEHLGHETEAGGFTLLAVNQRSCKKGGPEIVGHLSVDVGDRPRTCHRAQFGICVRQDFWHQGVGTRLMQQAVATIEQCQTIEVLACAVRSDNFQAIQLYERFGLHKTGIERGLMKIDDELVDATIMSRVFHRSVPKEGGPLFYLGDVLDAIDGASSELSWYACLDTGEIEASMNDEWGDSWGGEESFDSDGAEGTWVDLPSSFEIDDWRTMRDFALQQNDDLRDVLLNTIHRRGAYRNFKDVCGRCGILSEYHAFLSARHRDIAIAWLEDHGCTWTEGRSPRF